MKKVNGNNFKNDNNIRKLIIQRINNNIKNKNLTKRNSNNYNSKKINLSLNNNINFKFKELNNSNINTNNNTYGYYHFNNNYNIFLDNINPLYFKKTRNKINFNKTEQKKIKSLLDNKSNNLINNQSFNEEIRRKLYLNFENNFTNKISINNKMNSKKKIYIKSIFRQNSKIKYNNEKNKFFYERNNSENNSYFSNKNNKYFDENLSTLEFSILDRKNNSINYKNNLQKKINGISNDNKIINNNNIIERNNTIINNSSYIYKKNIIHKMEKNKKHYTSKSQENIHEDSIKYNYLFIKNNNKIIKKKENKYNFYKNKVNYIIKIQKWWKYMLFHMYIEQKIIFIQNKFRLYLINKKYKNNLSLIYLNNISKILLIQKEWKKFIKTKNIKITKINFDKNNNYKKDIYKLITFKLDNFDINNNDYNNKKNNKIKKNYIFPSNNQKKVYMKKNINKRNNPIKKSNTVSHFYFKKNYIHSDDKKNFVIQKNAINFYIKSIDKKNNFNEELKKNKIKINELKNKYKCIKNISIEINKYSENKINEIILQRPVNIKCFFEKEYRIKTYKNIMTINKEKNYFFSKKRKNILFLNYILLIQKNIRKYLNEKKYKFIIKPISINYYLTKIIKKRNLLQNSNLNQNEIFSFNGSNLIDISNKDKNNEKEIVNLKKGKIFISNNVNLLSFDENNKIVNYKNSNLQYYNPNSEKLKKIFNKYFIFIVITNLKNIKKNILLFRLITKIKKYINNQIYKLLFDSFKKYLLIENKNENIIDNDEIDNKININTKYIKNSPFLISLIENKNRIISEELYKNDEELTNYIYNYFYNEKKFTNISIKLIKERLIKCPLINRDKNSILKYMHNLYRDIETNKICHICFCKYGEKNKDNCICHLNTNNQIIHNKSGISIYRQRMNKIINDINNKKRLNNDKINNIKIKNNNNENIDNYNFQILNNNHKISFEDNEQKYNIINRYDTDSVNS